MVEMSDEMVEPEPDRQQVEQRLEEARDEEDPPSPVGDDVSGDESSCPAPGRPERGKDPK